MSVSLSSLTLSEDVRRLNPQVWVQPPSAVADRALPDGPKFKSHLEGRAWREWAQLMGARQVEYECASLRLCVNAQKLRRYTPDFWLWFGPGDLCIVEVKGSWKANVSGRSSKANVTHAAVQYALLARWFVLMPERGGGWLLDEIMPDGTWLEVPCAVVVPLARLNPTQNFSSSQ